MIPCQIGVLGRRWLALCGNVAKGMTAASVAPSMDCHVIDTRTVNRATSVVSYRTYACCVVTAAASSAQRQGANTIMWNADYFSDMSATDWFGIALMAPFLAAMVLLFVYLTIGLIGSGPRRRRVAEQRRNQKKIVAEDTSASTSQPLPGD